MNNDWHVRTSVPAPCLSTVLELLDSLKKTLPIDHRMIYVVGFSMGGSAAVNAVQLRPDLFAAAIAISGIPALDGLDQLAGIPLWVVHGNNDHENPIATDLLLRIAMSARHARQFWFWEVDGLEHDIYAPLYTTNAVPQWLFQHRRKR